LGAVAWTSMYESLAQMEEKTAKLMADAGYGAMLKKAEGLVVPGSAHDQDGAISSQTKTAAGGKFTIPPAAPRPRTARAPL
jgi:hypothetical protein